MKIVWPDTPDLFMLDIPSADYICRLVRAKLAGTERDILPPGINRIKMQDDYHRAPTSLFKTMVQPSDTISVYLWPTMKETTGVLMWPIGPSSKEGNAGAIRFFRFSLTAGTYMNYGSSNGFVVDHAPWMLTLTKTNIRKKYEPSRIRSTRLEPNGTYGTIASMHMFTRVYPERGLRLNILSPGTRHNNYYSGQVREDMVGFTSLDPYVRSGRWRSTAEWQNRCPGIVLDLTDPVFPVSDQDLMFMMI